MYKDAKKRCMMFWYTTVVPCLQKLDTEENVGRAFVVEDTCICAPGVDFRVVEGETRGIPAGVFGYGGYEEKDNGLPSWFGSKGFCVYREWWQEMSIVLSNSQLSSTLGQLAC